MSPKEFQKRFAGDLNIFLKSECGKALIETMNALAPVANIRLDPHQMHFCLGGMAGFSEYQDKLIALANPAKDVPQPQANYGVEKPAVK